MEKIKKLFSYNFSELKLDFYSFLDFLKKNKLTVILCWFFLLFSYGIKLFYYSISIDSESMLVFQEGVMHSWIGISRFGLVFTKELIKLIPFNPFVANFLMIVTTFCASLFLSFLFFSLDEKFGNSNTSKASFILPCLFITNPLFLEQFNFTLQSFEVALAIFLVFLGNFCVTQWIFDSKKVLHLLVGLVSSIWSFWSYQSLIFLHISVSLALFVCICINNLKCSTKKFEKSFFRISAVKYFLTFVLSYLIHFYLNKLVLIKKGFPVFSGYLNNMICWKHKSKISCIKDILKYMSGYKFYFLLALIFFIFVFFIIVKNHKIENRFLFLLAVFGLLLSPFFLSFCLGGALIARMQFSLPFVFAFIFYFFIKHLSEKSFIKPLFTVFSLLLSFKQSYTVASFFYYDYIRYKEDVYIANRIFSRIDSFDIQNINDVPVVFFGKLEPKVVPQKFRGDVSGYSFFEWDCGCHFGASFRPIDFMSTLGYKYKKPSKEEVEKAEKIAENMKVWPSPESVRYEQGIVVVKLS